MRVLAERPDFFDHAACSGMAEDLGGEARDRHFFPKHGASTQPGKAICADCPVAQECLDYALEQGFTTGIWGGTSEHERRGMRARRRAEERAS